MWNFQLKLISTIFYNFHTTSSGKNYKDVLRSELISSRNEKEEINKDEQAHEDQIDIIVFDVRRR